MRRAALGAVVATMLLAGCASGGDDAASTGTAGQQAASGAGSADFQAYTQCLSENGVDVSSFPQGGGQGGPGGQRPSGAPTDMPSGFPTDMPSGAPSDFPSGGPPQGGQGGGPGGMGSRIPDGVDEQTWQAAQTACADLRPTGGPGMGRGGPNGSGNGSGNGTVDYTVFWQCMSDHKVDKPASGLPADLDTSDATVKAALEVCNALLPSATPPPTRADPAVSPSESAS